jgi:hypothetical protein
MIVSLVYQVTRKLLPVPVVLLRRQVAKDAELLVLRRQNAVLRRQLTGPVCYEAADRLWFAALSSKSTSSTASAASAVSTRNSSASADVGCGLPAQTEGLPARVPGLGAQFFFDADELVVLGGPVGA